VIAVDRGDDREAPLDMGEVLVVMAQNQTGSLVIIERQRQFVRTFRPRKQGSGLMSSLSLRKVHATLAVKSIESVDSLPRVSP
jgi:predicted RNase H-like nuclease (RuvC/YqgF family)